MPTNSPATSHTDASSGRFLRAVGRSLPVLAAAASAPQPSAEQLALRTLAGDVRQHTVDHLADHLRAASVAIEQRGGHVHWSADAAAARSVIALLGGGSVIAGAVVDEVGVAAGDGPAVVTGAAFVVAETGRVCLTGDAAAVTAAVAAPVLVCLAGIESVVPRSADLAVLLKVWGEAAPIEYAAVVGADLARVLHVVWVDNGRAAVLAGEYRSALRCIGCGACSAVCPVYRWTGAPAAGLWAGPIGAVTRSATDPAAAVVLPHASTLCGACADVCPVRIDLPTHLLALRRHAPVHRHTMRLWAWAMGSPGRFRWAVRLQRVRGRAGWPTPAKRSFQQMWRDR